jgi:cation diffusion facilitator CzcD-associated flavoprotein CzcO
MATDLYGEAIARIAPTRRPPRPSVPSHPFGCKRPIIDQGYYETFNRDNVTLVDSSADPMKSVTPNGIDTETATTTST